MQTVVHIVCRDKFTCGYVNFMKSAFKEISQHFIIIDNGFDLSEMDCENVIYVQSYMAITRDRRIKKYLEESDKIIVTGFFAPAKAVSLLSKKLLKKTYIQLWGGDFYCFSDKIKRLNLKEYASRLLKYRALKNCKSLIFLIPGEYDKFHDITGIKNDYLIAPMPSDPKKQIDYLKYVKDAPTSTMKRIIIGNCADTTNKHEKVLRTLSRFKQENIQIICPLSYGDMGVKEKVINIGEDLFGNKFVAITEYMSLHKYRQLLASCDVGIFAMNRQQAMGNINDLLAMGKKIYLQQGTSMWNRYEDLGFHIYDIAELDSIGFSEIDSITNHEKEENTLLGISLQSFENFRLQWDEILEK